MRPANTASLTLKHRIFLRPRQKIRQFHVAHEFFSLWQELVGSGLSRRGCDLMPGEPSPVRGRILRSHTPAPYGARLASSTRIGTAWQIPASSDCKLADPTASLAASRKAVRTSLMSWTRDSGTMDRLLVVGLELHLCEAFRAFKNLFRPRWKGRCRSKKPGAQRGHSLSSWVNYLGEPPNQVQMFLPLPQRVPGKLGPFLFR